MVKRMPFKHQHLSSNLRGLTHGYRLMVDFSSSKRNVLIRIQLAISPRVNRLIGKLLSCQERRRRFEPGLTRKGKVAMGKAKCLLNIVFIHLDVRIIFFPL